MRMSDRVRANKQLLTISLLVLTGLVLAYLVNLPPISREELFTPIYSEMTWGYFVYGSHPKQHLLFIVLTLLSPFYCLFSILMSRKICFTKENFLIKPRLVGISKLIFCTLILMLLLLGLYFFYQSYYVEKSLVFISHNPEIIFLLVSALLFGVLISLFFSGYRPYMVSDRVRFLVRIVVVGLTIFAILFHVFALRIINFNFLTHLVSWRKIGNILFDLEPVYYAVVQVVYGKTLLANLTTQYGLFAEVLNPIFKIIGLSLFKFSVVMELLEGLAFSVLLWVAYKLTKSALLSGLFILSICCITGGIFIWIFGYDFPSPYYQYWPIRIIFPALSLFLFLRFVDRMNTGRIIVMGCCTSLAFFWNFESGIPVFGATVAYLFCLIVFPVFKEKWFYLRLLLSYLASIFVLLILLALYLELKSNFAIQWGNLFNTDFHSLVNRHN